MIDSKNNLCNLRFFLKRLTVRVPVVASNERSGLDKRTSWLSTLSDFKFADVVTLRSLIVTVLLTTCKFSDDVKTSNHSLSNHLSVGCFPRVCLLFHKIPNIRFDILLSHDLLSDLWLKQLRSPL